MIEARAELIASDGYLSGVLSRESVSACSLSAVLAAHVALEAALQKCAGVTLRRLQPCGSFAKGTANRGARVDFLISLSSSADGVLEQSYEKLMAHLTGLGYSPSRRDRAMNVSVDGISVDLLLARHHGGIDEDHSLYLHGKGIEVETNIAQHVRIVRSSGKANEIRLVKLWRDQKRIDFPSFYLELAVLQALSGTAGSLSENVWRVFEFLYDTLAGARLADPANASNVVSNGLSELDRAKVKVKAMKALSAATWTEIVA